MSNQTIKFDERKQNQPIKFDGGTNEVCEGCTVNLEHNGVTIAVRLDTCQGNVWTGEITEFPNNDGETTVGKLKIGTTIKFEEKHIFRCAA